MTTHQAVIALYVLLAALCIGLCTFAHYLGGPYALAVVVVILAVIL